MSNLIKYAGTIILLISMSGCFIVDQPRPRQLPWYQSTPSDCWYDTYLHEDCCTFEEYTYNRTGNYWEHCTYIVCTEPYTHGYTNERFQCRPL